eukprot:TRINITY_DN65596_c0_g1_i1.p1 TRINITY_DN65596_c0_g1~~TRINITY_DN65596_c0_g1_i1.p1  ORF type:complete len:427 (+),score=74.03 TRINITY_DN65596_c0_g1_i1:106-1386(+)
MSSGGQQPSANGSAAAAGGGSGRSSGRGGARARKRRSLQVRTSYSRGSRAERTHSAHLHGDAAAAAGTDSPVSTNSQGRANSVLSLSGSDHHHEAHSAGGVSPQPRRSGRAHQGPRRGSHPAAGGDVAAQFAWGSPSAAAFRAHAAAPGQCPAAQLACGEPRRALGCPGAAPANAATQTTPRGRPEARSCPAGAAGEQLQDGRTRLLELLPEETLLEILLHLLPPEVVGLLNASPLLRARLDKPELWKGIWFWLAEEFSGAVTVHRLLARAGQEGAFGWKMLVLLDWRFQYRKLSYEAVRSMAKEWCARLREIGLVLGVGGVAQGIGRIHALLLALRRLYTGQATEGGDDTVSTEDEYEHDKEWEITMAAGMALANVRREVLSSLSLRGVDVDRLPRHYERIFARYRELHVHRDSPSPKPPGGAPS